MSIASIFKKERLFQSLNRFSRPVNNKYLESIYYLINNVEYNSKNEVVKVNVTIIIDVQNYLDLQPHRKIEEVFENDIPKDILLNVKAWEMLS